MKNMFLSFILLFSACTKDKTPIKFAEETLPHCLIIADSLQNCYFVDFPIEKEMTILWDSINLYGTAKDSLDLDQDNNFDLFFNLSIYNLDSINYLNSLPSYNPAFYQLEFRNDFQIKFNTHFAYMGQGYATTQFFCDTLKESEELCTTNKWTETTIKKMNLWYESQSSNPNYTSGSWFDIDSIYYLGFRNKNKLGWVKINHADRFNPKIMGYRLEK